MKQCLQKQYLQNDMKLVNVSGNSKKMFVVINNVGIKINACNVIKHVMLVNIQTMKIVNTEKNQLHN